jgi:hypothetical protein
MVPRILSNAALYNARTLQKSEVTFTESVLLISLIKASSPKCSPLLNSLTTISSSSGSSEFLTQAIVPSSMM